MNSKTIQQNAGLNEDLIRLCEVDPDHFTHFAQNTFYFSPAPVEEITIFSDCEPTIYLGMAVWWMLKQMIHCFIWEPEPIFAWNTAADFIYLTKVRSLDEATVISAYIKWKEIK